MDKNNIQHKLTRVRPPRVRMTFDVETYGSTKSVDLPFVISVITDISGDQKEVKNINELDFIEITAATFDEFVRFVSPMLTFAIEVDGESVDVLLNFTSIVDFEPYSICQSVQYSKELNEKYNFLGMFLARAETNNALISGLTELLSDENSTQIADEVIDEMLNSLTPS